MVGVDRDRGPGQVSGCYECGDEPSASVKWKNFPTSWQILASEKTFLYGAYILTVLQEIPRN
jgi:hypothetical protein